MYDVMLEEAKMWLDEPPTRKRKLETPANPPPPPPCPPVDVDSDEEEVDPVAEAKYERQVSESGGFDVDLFISPNFGGIHPSGCTDGHILFGKVGLHWYNHEKGTNLQFKKVIKVNGEISSLFNFYITLEAMDPVHNSLVTFQTCVTDTVPQHLARLRIFTSACRIKPQVPGMGETGSCWYPDTHVDACYRVDLPDWLQDDALTGGDKLQFYEVKDWELKDNEWLYLYAEFALFSKWEDDLSAYMPFEMKKVVVQTKEDVEPSMKLKSSNAVFYLSFKARGGLKCRGMVRRTSDGRPEHMCLEARCWIDK